MSNIEEPVSVAVPLPEVQTTTRIPPSRKCETCGNVYDKAFEIVIGGESHTFDCFECAIHALAPVCGHCQCRIIGHGVESPATIYCCAHCASVAGTPGLRDRTGSSHP